MSKDGNSHGGRILCYAVWSDSVDHPFPVGKLNYFQLPESKNQTYSGFNIESFISLTERGDRKWAVQAESCKTQVFLSAPPGLPCWISSLCFLSHGGKVAAAPLGLIFKVGRRGQGHTSQTVVSSYLESKRFPWTLSRSLLSSHWPEQGHVVTLNRLKKWVLAGRTANLNYSVVVLVQKSEEWMDAV